MFKHIPFRFLVAVSGSCLLVVGLSNVMFGAWIVMRPACHTLTPLDCTASSHCTTERDYYATTNGTHEELSCVTKSP